MDLFLVDRTPTVVAAQMDYLCILHAFYNVHVYMLFIIKSKIIITK